MKNNENKTGRITNFYNRLQRKEDKINSGTSIAAIILAIAVFITFAVFEGELFKYPETEYQYLETQVEKVIVDNRYIDMEQLPDKTLYTSITYNFPAPDEEWESCQIRISKSKNDSYVDASITKSDDGTLNMDVTYEFSNRVEYYGGIIMGSIVAIIIIDFACAIILRICFAIFLFIIRILKDIEKSLKRRKKV